MTLHRAPRHPPRRKGVTWQKVQGPVWASFFLTVLVIVVRSVRNVVIRCYERVL
jgi:hypothetical protein